MTERPALLTIVRSQGASDGLVKIELREERTHKVIVRAMVTVEQFGLSVLGMAQVPCVLETPEPKT